MSRRDFPRKALGPADFAGGSGLSRFDESSLIDLFNRSRLAANAGGYLVDPDLDGAFASVGEAVAQAKADGVKAAPILLAPGHDLALPSGGLVLDGARDWFFVGAHGGDLAGSNSRSRLRGILDTDETSSWATFYNKSLSFRNIDLTLDLTIRKGHQLNVYDCSLESSRLFHKLGTSMFEAPRSAFYNCIFNGGFTFDHLDNPGVMLLTWLFFVNCSPIFNDSLGSPLKVGGASYGMTVRFFRCAPIWFGTVVGGLPFLDAENRNVVVEVGDSTFDISGTPAPGAFVGNAASARMFWKGNANILRSPAASALALDLGAFSSVEGAPFIDTGLAPTNRPPGTEYRDRGASWKRLTWNGAAWV